MSHLTLPNGMTFLAYVYQMMKVTHRHAYCQLHCSSCNKSLVAYLIDDIEAYTSGQLVDVRMEDTIAEACKFRGERNI